MRSLTAPTVLRKLKKLYNPPKTFLHFKTPLDLLIATILSAQCTDARVNIVSKDLFKKYKTAKDYAEVSQEELERDIHSCGTYRVKAKHIRTLAKMLTREFRGKVPESMEELTRFPGVGRKTANVILAAAFGKSVGIAVDTHVLRVSRRLGLTNHTTPERIELDLMKQAAKKDWGRLTTLLISHGRAVCTAKNRRCDRCIFQKECPSSFVMGRKDRTGQDVRSRPS